jgi:hypothetical protein
MASDFYTELSDISKILTECTTSECVHNQHIAFDNIVQNMNNYEKNLQNFQIRATTLQLDVDNLYQFNYLKIWGLVISISLGLIVINNS